MKTLILILASMAATLLAPLRRLPFSTANAGPTAASNAEDIDTLKARLDAQDEELARLRREAAIPAAPQVATATALLCKGAGVEPENVNWRIRAGLSAAQAVEVAAREKAEAEEAESKKSKSRKAEPEA